MLRNALRRWPRGGSGGAAALLRASATAVPPRSTCVSQRAFASRQYTSSSSRSNNTALRKSPRGVSATAIAKRERDVRAHAQLLLALQTFYKNERHFAVPYNFVVPAPSPFPSAFSSARRPPASMEQGDSEDVIVPHHLQHESWSKELHGMRLGVKVHKFVQAVMKGTHKQSAKQLAQLTELGFPWSDWREYVFENVTVPALETYLQKEGHLFVPQKFVCPHGDQTWPRPTWGFPLGTQVATLRKHKDTSLLADHHVEVLGQMGFVWKVRDAKWFQYFLPGLRHYKSVYGHVDVPLAFVIPDQQQSSSTSLQQGDEGNAEWPVYLGGYMLGRHVYMVRSGKYADQVEESRAELNALGFSFNLSDSMWTHTILPALRVFAQVHRHCDVHQEFVVPSWAPWPEKAWGLKLGHTVKSIRQGAYEAQVQASRDDLERLGFVWNAKQRLERTVRDIVLPAMATYRKLHGHVLISTDFVVPKNDAAWPEFARGFKLGHWITRARSGHVDVPSHLRRELDHVGFVWRFNDARWNEILLPSFRVYAKLHGTCHGMSTKFHVPHEPPYPEQAWGANLGGAVWHMRNGDTYVNDDEKQRELRALGVLE